MPKNRAEVIDAQKTMAQRGVYKGKIDGDWGPISSAAYWGLRKMNELGQTSPVVTPGQKLAGRQAVQKAEQLYGKLSPAEARIVELEGFVDGVYLDEKDVPTYGVGQTGEYIDKGFKEAFAEKEKLARKLIPSYDALSPSLQGEIMSGVYRGDLSGSPKALRLINEGRYADAATEFLDNAEYKSDKTSRGVKLRMESIANALRNEDPQLELDLGLQRLVASR